MVFIYTLLLEQNKYYVGKTNNPHFRLENHFYSNGSEWTKLYKPIKLLELKANCDDYDEDKITRQYMDKYGIDNVRGGTFVSVKLDNDSINVLNKMSNGTNNKCFKCGSNDHFVKDCKQNNTTNTTNTPVSSKANENKPNVIINHYYICNNTNSNKLYYKKQKETCFRCGREGHYSTSCYASTHIKGFYLK
jgi:hypothetical protein